MSLKPPEALNCVMCNNVPSDGSLSLSSLPQDPSDNLTNYELILNCVLPSFWTCNPTRDTLPPNFSPDLGHHTLKICSTCSTLLQGLWKNGSQLRSRISSASYFSEKFLKVKVQGQEVVEIAPPEDHSFPSCVVCSIPLLPSDTYLSLAAKSKGSSESNFDLLHKCLRPSFWTSSGDSSKYISSMEPLGKKYEEQRKICMRCSHELKNASRFSSQFKERISTSSYVYRHLLEDKNLKVDAASQTDREIILKSVELIPKPKLPKVSAPPIKKYMLQAFKTKRLCTSMCNTIKGIVHKEILKYTQEKIKKEIIEEEELHNFLLKECPMTLSLLQALLLKSCLQNKLTEKMKLFLDVSANHQSQVCNTFQKNIGKMLYIGKATKDTINRFNKLGLSTAYATLIRVHPVSSGETQETQGPLVTLRCPNKRNKMSRLGIKKNVPVEDTPSISSDKDNDENVLTTEKTVSKEGSPVLATKIRNKKKSVKSDKNKSASKKRKIQNKVEEGGMDLLSTTAILLDLENSSGQEEK